MVWLIKIRELIYFEIYLMDWLLMTQRWDIIRNFSILPKYCWWWQFDCMIVC